MRKRYAVRNALRWLEVRANPTAISLEDFRHLFIGEPLVDANTINFFVDQVGTEFLKRWATPLVRSVPKMAQMEHLIPACILAHHAAKARGEAGYIAGKWVSEGAPTWRWEVGVSKVDDTGVSQVCHFHGFGDIWEDSSMRIGQPALWLFDYRCSGSSSPRSAWDTTDYAKAVMQMRFWMRDVPRYNAVFMLPQSHTYHEVVQHLALPENATHHRGVWAFTNPMQERGPVLMHEGQIEGMYEAFTDLVIVHVQPLGSSHSENLGPRRGGYSQQCIYWENDATSWRAPNCDRGAREPETMRELCTSYLPRSWALVVQGLTVAASAFDCSEGHQIHRIVVLENDPDREAYIRRQLIATHDAESEGVQGGARVVEEGT